jgi:hypothetical protein
MQVFLSKLFLRVEDVDGDEGRVKEENELRTINAYLHKQSKKYLASPRTYPALHILFNQSLQLPFMKSGRKLSSCRCARVSIICIIISKYGLAPRPFKRLLSIKHEERITTSPKLRRVSFVEKIIDSYLASDSLIEISRVPQAPIAILQMVELSQAVMRPTAYYC